MSDPDKDQAVQADIEKILGDLTQRAYTGQIRGIAVATVTEAGFSCRFAHFDQQRGPLLASVVLLQQDIVNSFELRNAPPIDGEEPTA